MNRTTTRTGALVATLALTGTLGVGQASAAQSSGVGHTTTARTVAASTTTSAVGGLTDRQFNQILTAMENLPERLKNMSPSDPRFQAELKRLSTLRVNWAWCAVKVGQFAVEMALPVTKIVRAFKAAKAAFGSWSAVYKAIKAGHASDVIGPEAVEILDQLTGASGVIDACT